MNKASMISSRIFQYTFMAGVLIMINIFSVKANSFYTSQKDSPSVIGRWDITVNIDGKQYPSWLEVHRSGIKTLVGEFVGISGSARPISRINFIDGTITFSLPPQWETYDNDLSFEAHFEADSLSGTMITGDGKNYRWTGVRAPLLHRNAEPVWQKPIALFNGKDLTGWHATGENQWTVKDGILQNPHKGSNLMTDETFNDFKLHIEFRYTEGSNSGVYLRGRYEVQIETNSADEPLKNVFSAVYGFIMPSEIVAKNAGEWQSYDITLIGRMVTVVANGKMVICNREIPGITGGAINSREGEPGPLIIQGDEGGHIEYRNIVITLAK
jgi:hypothetical protein